MGAQRAALYPTIGPRTVFRIAVKVKCANGTLVKAHFSLEICRILRTGEKSTKRWLEVAFDLMGWPKVVQNAEYAKKFFFYNTGGAHRGDFRAQ